VAIDQASVDLVNGETGNRSSKLPGLGNLEKINFEAIYPEVGLNVQLALRRRDRDGNQGYELIKI